MGDHRFLWMMRIVLLGFSALVLAFALNSEASIYKMVENAYKITLAGAFMPLVAGILWKRATTQGALASIFGGLVAWLLVELLIGATSPVPSQLIGLRSPRWACWRAHCCRNGSATRHPAGRCTSCNTSRRWKRTTLPSIRITIEVPRTTTHPGVNMKKLLITAALVFASQFAFAQAAAPAGDCEAKAIGKNGKPLAGAAKTTFMKKCMADAGAATATPAAAAGTADCEAKAIGKNGKPLAGAAKTTFMKKCTADAGAATAAPAAAGRFRLCGKGR